MKRKTRKALPRLAAYAATLATLVVAMGYAALSTLGQAVPDEYGCLAGVSDERPQTVIWLDATSLGVTAQQRRSVHLAIERGYQALGGFERLSIYTTQERSYSAVPKPVVTVCGTARTSEELKAVGAPPAQAAYLDAQRVKIFQTHLAPVLDEMLTNPDEQPSSIGYSPVLENFASLSRTLRPGDRFWPVTDGLQNTKAGGQFCYERGAMPRFPTYAQRRNYQSLLKPETLSGVDVTFLMIGLTSYGPYCSGEAEVRRFHEDYFSANDAASLKFIRIAE